MSKFELYPTVNESGNSILLKLRILEKHSFAQRLCDASSNEK